MESLKVIMDGVAIIISVIALVVSRKAERSARRDKETEMEWTLRSQIGEAVTRIAASEAELEDIETEVRDAASEERRSRFRSKRSILNRQKYSMARQASYLMRQNKMRGRPDLVSDEEYATVARVLADHDDPETEEYWSEAIKAAEGYHKAMHQRGYAKSLFRQGKTNEGRQQYQEAVSCEATPTSRMLWERMWTYVEWARSEDGATCRDKAKDCFQRAREACEQIDQKQKKDEGLTILSGQYKMIFGAE